MKNIPRNVKSILWDVDPKSINARKHKNFLITRIVEKGGLLEIKWLKKYFSIGEIKTTVLRSRNISLKTKNYWKVF